MIQIPLIPLVEDANDTTLQCLTADDANLTTQYFRAIQDHTEYEANHFSVTNVGHPASTSGKIYYWGRTCGFPRPCLLDSASNSISYSRHCRLPCGPRVSRAAHLVPVGFQGNTYQLASFLYACHSSSWTMITHSRFCILCVSVLNETQNLESGYEQWLQLL